MAPYAASAKEKAIACLSTEARPRYNSEAHSGGNARAQRRTLGILAEYLTASAALVTVHWLTHVLPLRSA